MGPLHYTQTWFCCGNHCICSEPPLKAHVSTHDPLLKSWALSWEERGHPTCYQHTVQQPAFAVIWVCIIAHSFQKTIKCLSFNIGCIVLVVLTIKTGFQLICKAPSAIQQVKLDFCCFTALYRNGEFGVLHSDAVINERFFGVHFICSVKISATVS